ncbi:MAG: deoxyribodipyrimidine photo-lyase [Burkholderiales bacterium]|nr:deoxyribodipyrimidine photo-lyase [Burkholderiales bacterium]
MLKTIRPPLNTSLVWFRRDLRCFDHAALYAALKQSQSVYCVFIFDKDILDLLPSKDRRVHFIDQSVRELAAEIEKMGGNLIVRYGSPKQEIPKLALELQAQAVLVNHDYEPQAIQRDSQIKLSLAQIDCDFLSFKDQVIFENNEVLSQAGTPFSIFTPYKNAWLKKLLAGGDDFYCKPYPVETYAENLSKYSGAEFPDLGDMGFTTIDQTETRLQGGMKAGAILFEDFLSRIHNYELARNFPAIKGPSYLSVHLRFGTVSIRHLVREAINCVRTGNAHQGSQVWLSELIWRDFYFMILQHHPRVVDRSFKADYDAIVWESGTHAEQAFIAWCEGKTGYPLIDAAMLQLNNTGYMHNRLRMVAACFLVKDLGIDWRWGERYFALHLNDYDLSANNGGWQWAASTGCDAQPYFRIFNPITQSEKFDPQGKFIRRYLPVLAQLESKQIHAPWMLSTSVLNQAGITLGENYPSPIIAHDEARKSTLARYAVVKK